MDIVEIGQLCPQLSDFKIFRFFSLFSQETGQLGCTDPETQQ